MGQILLPCKPCGMRLGRIDPRLNSNERTGLDRTGSERTGQIRCSHISEREQAVPSFDGVSRRVTPVNELPLGCVWAIRVKSGKTSAIFSWATVAQHLLTWFPITLPQAQLKKSRIRGEPRYTEVHLMAVSTVEDVNLLVRCFAYIYQMKRQDS